MPSNVLSVSIIYFEKGDFAPLNYRASVDKFRNLMKQLIIFSDVGLYLAVQRVRLVVVSNF